MESLIKQLKKGVLEILVLDLLNHKEAYGYEIITYLDEKSDGYYKLKEGSLYPVLYRLEDRGDIESFRKQLDTSRKVPRKYYRITEKGSTNLKGMLKTLNKHNDITMKLLSMEVKK